MRSDWGADQVLHPAHYTAGGIELIDFIKAKLSSMPVTPWQGFLWGSLIQYVCRFPFKGEPGKDLEKTSVYLNWLRETIGERKEDK